MLIVEAGETSGTLTTASMAIEDGKDIFVVPGDLTRPMSIGCNRLLQQGANVYTGVDDILGLLFPGYAKQHRDPLQQLRGIQRDIYLEIKSGELAGAQIIQKLGITTSEFNQAITMLELQDYVLALGCNNWGIPA